MNMRYLEEVECDGVVDSDGVHSVYEYGNRDIILVESVLVHKEDGTIMMPEFTRIRDKQYFLSESYVESVMNLVNLDGFRDPARKNN